jgi:YggT family protein
VELVCWVIQLFVFAVLGRILLSWFPLAPGGVAAQIFSLLYTITEPVLGPIRRAIPPIGMGGMGFDLSPIIVIIGTRILAGLLGC